VPLRRAHAYLLTLLSVCSSVLVLTHPAHAIAAPSRVEVHYTSSYAEVRWSSVSDATSYSIEVSKVGYNGPWRWWNTGSATTYAKIPLNGHPYLDQDGAYRYKVIAHNSAGSAARSVALNRSQGSGVSAQDTKKAASKANSCLQQGLKAGTTTAAGAGVYAVGAAWIPGVDAATAAGVSLAVGGSAASTYIVCLLPW
jgi:hypothetical protein